MPDLVLHTAPAVEPIEADEVAKRLGLFEVDDRIGAFITAARQSLEGVRGSLERALITQTWDLYLDEFPCGELRLPFPPFQEVVEITVTDDAGAELPIPRSSYRVLKGEFGRVLPVGSWPRVGAIGQGVRIRFVAGYGDDGAAVEKAAAPIVQALVLMVGRMLAVSRADMALRSRTVEGVGATTWMNPDDVRKGITATEDALLAPYRVYS
ncbi:hypothetical protein [Aureimonas sp. AU12]|uniref:head-tail connector protein n=1 Tax=Aureimonas sp. AU12 TaxID=1638161 RepID=UPI000785C4D3|nr:hypothetical protein [Aureimonas sp. AU12]